jgi:hypothetical protein
MGHLTWIFRKSVANFWSPRDSETALVLNTVYKLLIH